MRNGDEHERGARGWAAVAMLVVALGCNSHPLAPVEAVVTATRHEVVHVPEKTRLDFLFVIDSSQSMCQEQDNLTRNFAAFAGLFDELGSAADYRIAVTSMDMRDPDQRGRFLAAPAEPVETRTCRGVVPATADCPADLPTILRSGREGNIEDAADLRRKFRCLATLGTQGNGIEMGLESMRLALSCDGPNAERFGECCRDGQYDPACLPTEEPEFLRPDATLVVVFISDENDCSQPNANPAASSLAICKYGTRDSDGDSVPDGFRDPLLCAGDPAACYAVECGDLDPATCRATRCLIDDREQNNCEWQRERLTPVDDYVRFLKGLKAQPNESVVVASIVGERAYTHTGRLPVQFEAGGAPEGCLPDSVDAFDPAVHLSERCCPDGRCEGAVRPSCTSENGVAYAGRRYLELAEGFGAAGIGCPEGMEGDAGECVSICTADFAAPLGAIKDRVRDRIAGRCLDERPACRVWEAGAARPCATDEERRDPANRSLQVRLRCTRTVDQGGACAMAEDRTLGAGEYRLVLDAAECASGAWVELDALPQGGSSIEIDYRIDVGL